MVWLTGDKSNHPMNNHIRQSSHTGVAYIPRTLPSAQPKGTIRTEKTSQSGRYCVAQRSPMAGSQEEVPFKHRRYSIGKTAGTEPKEPHQEHPQQERTLESTGQGMAPRDSREAHAKVKEVAGQSSSGSNGEQHTDGTDYAQDKTEHGAKSAASAAGCDIKKAAEKIHDAVKDSRQRWTYHPRPMRRRKRPG